MSGKTKSIIFQQEGPAHKCRLIDAPWRFDTSVVPPELLDVLFELRLQELEEQLHAETTYYKPVGGVAKPACSPIRIIDISEDNQVRIGLSWFPRKGINYSALASATFNEKEVAWLLQRWQKLYEDECFKVAFGTALEESELDHASVRRRKQELLKQKKLDDESVDVRRCEVIRQKGLNEETVKAKRVEAIREAELDDESVKAARELIHQRLRVNPDSIHPPASKPN